MDALWFEQHHYENLKLEQLEDEERRAALTELERSVLTAIEDAAQYENGVTVNELSFPATKLAPASVRAALRSLEAQSFITNVSPLDTDPLDAEWELSE